jgi:formamidopyrimidine-DNA glycosylase
MERTRRHGKHLFVALDDGTWLAFHFGMKGRLAYFKNLDKDPKHDRLRLDFDNGYHLAFVNQ